MKTTYYLHNGEDDFKREVVYNITLKDAIRAFEDLIEKYKAEGLPYKEARLIVESDRGLRLYEVGSRGGVFQSRKTW